MFSTLTDVARKTLGGRPRGALAERMKLVAGGRLELLGGDFGVGLVRIRRLEPDGRFGFVAPGGEQVILDAEVAAVLGWPDREEHRLLSATGWAWTVGSVIDRRGWRWAPESGCCIPGSGCSTCGCATAGCWWRGPTASRSRGSTRWL